jgi:hypothetical protein
MEKRSLQEQGSSEHREYEISIPSPLPELLNETIGGLSFICCACDLSASNKSQF